MDWTPPVWRHAGRGLGQLVRLLTASFERLPHGPAAGAGILMTRNSAQDNRRPGSECDHSYGGPRGPRWRLRILLAPTAPDLLQPGDRIRLVGRNSTGKTTTLRILAAGEVETYAGSVTRAGEIEHLPQDPKVGDLDVLARDRVLSARGLDVCY